MRAPAAQLRFLRRQEVPSPEAPAARADGAASRRPPGGGPILPLLAGCLAISALTLLFPSTPTYDPWAWILWGREITELDLVTTGGPSWKPLPILFTTVFSLFGDAAPYLWVWISRAGGLLGCVMAYRITKRLAGGSAYGVVGGVVAALALFSSFKYVRDAALGNSEPLLAALVLWAFERHLDGRRDHALYLGVAAALLRPEVWAFLGLYGIWLWLREPRLRLRLVGFAFLIPFLWFAPEWWGSGDPLRASTRATDPRPGSPAFADHPGLEVASRLWAVVIAPVKGGVLVALVYALVRWLRGHRETLIAAVLVGGLAWFLLVAGMTEAGYAGNQRYLIVTTAAITVLGGVGAALVLRGVGKLAERLSGNARVGGAVAAAFCLLAVGISAPFIAEKANNTERVSGGLEHEAELWTDLKTLIDRVGKDRILGCYGVFSGPFQNQMVAWELGLHGIRVGTVDTLPPGAVFRTRTVPDGGLVITPTDDRYRLVAHVGKWRLLTVPPEPNRDGCPAAGRDAPTAPAPRVPPSN